MPYDSAEQIRYKKMVRAMRRELGGGTDAKEAFKDIASHGADAGFAGFTYTADNVAFYKKHSEAIWDLLADSAEEQGMTAIELVASFKMAPRIQSGEQFEEALVWFALEMVAYRATDGDE